MNRVLLAYAPHMLRDYLMTRGGAMAVVAAVFVLPLVLTFAQATEAPPPEVMHSQGVGLLLALTPFLTLIATYGLIGQDFRLGFFRPLFAKPISVPLYYAVLFCCAGLTFWIVQGLSLLALAAFQINAWEPAAALDMSLRFGLLGGLTFAMSRVTRLDWLFAFLIYQLAAPLRTLLPAEETIRGFVINIIFPPTQLFELTPAARAEGQFSALIGASGPEGASIAWLIGYISVCVVIGLYTVRRLDPPPPLDQPRGTVRDRRSECRSGAVRDSLDADAAFSLAGAVLRAHSPVERDRHPAGIVRLQSDRLLFATSGGGACPVQDRAHRDRVGTGRHSPSSLVEAAPQVGTGVVEVGRLPDRVVPLGAANFQDLRGRRVPVVALDWKPRCPPPGHHPAALGLLMSHEHAVDDHAMHRQ